jgi:hypothetical protein
MNDPVAVARLMTGAMIASCGTGSDSRTTCGRSSKPACPAGTTSRTGGADLPALPAAVEVGVVVEHWLDKPVEVVFSGFMVATDAAPKK